MNLGNSMNYVVNATIFALLGFIIFGLGFWIFDRLTPYRLWEEVIEKKNLALAVLVGCSAIGMALIVASAIHG